VIGLGDFTAVPIGAERNCKAFRYRVQSLRSDVT
jgi:hypothetical protein